MAGIGMNKGKGVANAKKGIGIPKKAPAFGAGPVLRNPKGPKSLPYVAKGTGRGGQMKKMGGK